MPQPKGGTAKHLPARAESAQRLAANLKVLREAQHLSKSLLGLMAGISRPQLVAMEKGKANPTLETLAKLASALGIEVSELLE